MPGLLGFWGAANLFSHKTNNLPFSLPLGTHIHNVHPGSLSARSALCVLCCGAAMSSPTANKKAAALSLLASNTHEHNARAQKQLIARVQHQD